MKKKCKLFIVCLCFCIYLFIFFIRWNKIVGIIYGPEMDKIIIDNVAYVKCYTLHSSLHKSFHIGKGAWRNGIRVLDLYRIKGDKKFKYLYARYEWEGQTYVREDIENN